MYLKKEVENFNLVRTHMYYSGTKVLQIIPFTDDAFSQHIILAIFQTQRVNSIVHIPQPLDPYDFGFMNNSNTIKPIHMLAKSIPAHLTKDNYCKCQKQCVRNFSCKRLNLICDIACSCRGQEFCSRSKFDEEDV